MAKTRVSSSFVRSICFTLCLALSLSSLSLPASTQSQTQQPGIRTQGAPSSNLPNIDAVRNAVQPQINKPEPVRAKRCRHWDKKCKDLKEKKTSLFLTPEDNSDQMIASANPQTFDWLNQILPITSPLNLSSVLNRPVVDLPIGRRDSALDGRVSTATSRERRSSAGPLAAARRADSKLMPHAFASSLLPMMALQTNSFETARVEPHYRTGQSGEDLFSGNYNWSLPIVSLPGRAGHDLNLSLVYNSLVWTKAGSSIRFDQDYGWPSPGFRFGFPVFYGPYINSTTNRQAYILITPSGEAVEMRKVGGYETYEAEDSSYMQLKFNTTLSAWVLTAANGTQFIYGQTLEIKDRNGNRITATYDANGLMDTITDTLGRQILLEYGEYFELLKVKQNRNGALSTLAQFDYADQQLYFNFGSLYVDNVSQGQTIPLMYQVTLLDNSRYKFEWNTYGQVSKIRRYGGLTFERFWTNYNLPNYPSSPAQTDCPLFTTRTDWAYDWSVPAGVNTQFLFNQSATNPDAAMETTAPTLTYGQMTVPDGTVTKQYFYSSPASTYKWRYGLLKMSDTLENGVLRKRAKTNWEQPCGNGTPGNWVYQCNPRPAETNIYDNTDSDANTWENRRRTAFSYVDFNLVSDVYEYDTNATTVLRRTHNDYNLSSTYTTRRIVGLPSASFLYDGNSTLFSKVEYLYDESGYLQATSATPTQHDSSGYGIGFLAGRGNQTTVRRYDVTNQSYVEWKTGYNITGSPIFSRDPRYSTTNGQTTISYADLWIHPAHPLDNSYTGPNLNTFAYPTTVTDPDGYSSTIKYVYDIGAARFITDPKGAVTMHEHDGSGRRWKTTTGLGTGSEFYTSLNFDTQGNWVKSYSSIESGQPDFYSITTFDGHGRVRATVSDHPGSTGQYKAVYRGYDTMGRMTQISNPTEINSTWNPTGDDVAGWAWSFQSYDWQGRPLVSTNQDATTSSISYVGCGCAGGDMATTTDEGTVITNPNTGLPETKKRQQKVFRDALGRVVKTQALNWENGTPYSTTINVYNARDQITSVKEYSGDANGTEACPSATCQITNLTYDGHGRLWKQRRPIETADNVYQYNSDDTLWKATDPRNITATYSYNNRKLPTSIAYDSMPNAVLPSPLPSLPIPSASVTFGYDEAGSRTWMDDAPGRVDYVYDQLSRLKEETRLFDVGAISRSFNLKYEYNLAGQLKQITDPWNAVIAYNRDKAGQETGITGTGYKDVNQWTNRDVSTLASNIKYRAWGGIKQFTNGTLSGNNSFAMGYDSSLRLTSFTGGNRTTQQTYYNDGLVKDVTDLYYGSNFLRKYEYDHVSQLKKAHAGGTAQTSSSPYSLTYNYDAWGRMTSRGGSNWSNALTAYSTTFINDRDANMTFDPAGNVKGYSANYNDPYMHYNAASQLFTQLESGSQGLVTVRENYSDGEGAKIFYKSSNGSLINGGYSQFCNYFLIRSSALGGKVIAEFKDLTTLAANDPLKYYSKSYLYLKGVQLGFQENAHKVTGDKHVTWSYHNPTVGSYFAEYQLNNSGGQQVNYPGGEMTFDPLGSYVGITQPPQPQDISPFTFVSGQAMDPSGKCYADYVETRCEVVQKMLNNGSGAYAPLDNTSSVYNPITKRNELALFTTDWDNGFLGFVPTGANYHGDGTWSWTRSSSGRPTLNPRGTYENKHGRGFSPETTDEALSSIKLTLYFSGIFTDKDKKDQASAKALPGLLDCLGLYQGQITQIYNDNRVGSALAAAPNKAGARAAVNEVQKFLADPDNNSSMIQIVAHSNGNPTANYFLGLMAAKNSDFRVGSMLLIAPNVDSVATVDSMFSRSSSNILMQSNRDLALLFARVFTGASERMGAFKNGIKSPAEFIPTKQVGHGIQNYRKAHCGY